MRRVFRARHCTELASACRLLRSTLLFEGEGSRGITQKRTPGRGSEDAIRRPSQIGVLRQSTRRTERAFSHRLGESSRETDERCEFG